MFICSPFDIDYGNYKTEREITGLIAPRHPCILDRLVNGMRNASLDGLTSTGQASSSQTCFYPAIVENK